MLRAHRKSLALTAFLIASSLSAAGFAQPKPAAPKTPKTPAAASSSDAPLDPPPPAPPPTTTTAASAPPLPEPPPPPASAEPPPPAPPLPQLQFPPPPPPGPRPLPYYYPGYPGYPEHYFQIDPSEYAQAKPGAKGKWYGWQTGIVHGLSVLTLLLIPLDDDAIAPIAFPLGLGGLTLGAPIVHWAHGYLGKGFGSLGMIVGGSVGAYFMTATTACLTGLCSEGDYGGFAAFFLVGPIGGGVAFLTTTILDYVFLAYEENDSPGALPPPQEKAAKWSVQPFFDIGQNKASFGFGGQF